MISAENKVHWAYILTIKLDLCTTYYVFSIENVHLLSIEQIVWKHTHKKKLDDHNSQLMTPGYSSVGCHM